MFLRMVVGAGLVALGYYLGREVGRVEPLREELKRARENGDHEILEGDAEEVVEEIEEKKAGPAK